MTDYIKRDDAIKAFDPRQRRDWLTPWIVEELKDLPSADVAPVRHGRWKTYKTEVAGRGFFYCTKCRADAYDATNYCPNCGAKMDEETK